MTIDTFNALPVVRGSAWPGLEYFTTTRHSLNADELAQQFPSPPFYLQQVHGTHVAVAPASPKAQKPTADAAISTQSGRVLAIVTADCMPVVIADPQRGVLGVAHAGWRGLAGGVLENTIAAMRRAINNASNPSQLQLRAWIGPSIRQPSYEVGGDVYHAFVNQQPDFARYFQAGQKADKWQADLAGIAKTILQQQGVEAVEISPYCTYENDHYFYSYRRAPQTGRMVTAAWLL